MGREREKNEKDRGQTYKEKGGERTERQKKDETKGDRTRVGKGESHYVRSDQKRDRRERKTIRKQ